MFKRIVSYITLVLFIFNINSGVLSADMISQATLRDASSALGVVNSSLERSLKTSSSGRYDNDPDYIEALKVLDSMGLVSSNPIKSPNRDFWITMYRKYRDILARKAEKVVLPTDDPLIAPFGAFHPSSLLTPAQRVSEFGEVNYVSEIYGRPEYEKAAREVAMRMNLLEGGQGKNLGRAAYVKEVRKRDKLGAKGTDLVFVLEVNGKEYLVSIAEIKMLRLIKEAQSNEYKGIILEPIVSVGDEPSRPSYEELFAQPYLQDIIDGQETPRAYSDVLRELGISIRWHEAVPYPYIEIGTTRPVVGDASGSHGEWGFQFFREILQNPTPNRPTIRAFYNGDNTNAMPDRYIVGWMHDQSVPLVMLSTRRTNNDAKGGIMGVVKLSDGIAVPKMQELATAKTNNQAELFEQIGLNRTTQSATGEVGQQAFNTNTLLINDSLMSDILKELADIVGNEALYEIVAPDVISGTKKWAKTAREYTQIEGPIGTCLVNLNAFFLTIDTNEAYTQEQKDAIKSILKSRKIDRLLKIVDVPRTFFTPVKYAVDFWIQSCTNYYSKDFIGQRWQLEKAEGSGELPLMPFSVHDKYYLDISNFINAFGTDARIKGLEYFEVEGKVIARDAELVGHVEIINKTEEEFDVRKELPQLVVAGRLHLGNIRIVKGTDGNVSTAAITAPAKTASAGTTLQNRLDSIESIRDRINSELLLMSKELGSDISDETYAQIKKSADDALDKIVSLIKNNEINPFVQVRASVSDEAKQPSNEVLRIGVFPVAANPFHWAHLVIGLQAIAEFRLDKVIYVIAADDERKPDMIPAASRHPMAQEVLSLFEPLFEYSPIATEPVDGRTDLDGETNIFRILELNQGQKIDAFYMVGSDHYKRYNDQGSPDTIQKLEDKLADKIFNFNPLFHSVSVIFTERGKRGPEIPTTLDIKFIPEIDFEASSTAFRDGNYSIAPFTAYAIAKREGLYGLEKTSSAGSAIMTKWYLWRLKSANPSVRRTAAKSLASLIKQEPLKTVLLTAADDQGGFGHLMPTDLTLLEEYIKGNRDLNFSYTMSSIGTETVKIETRDEDWEYIPGYQHNQPTYTVDVEQEVHYEGKINITDLGPTKSASAGTILDINDISSLTMENVDRAIASAVSPADAKILSDVKLAAEVVKFGVDGTIVFDDEGVSEAQRATLRSLLDINSPYLYELEQRIGATVRLKSQLSQSDIKDPQKLIFISKEKLAGYRDAKYLLFQARVDLADGYLPVMPMIAMAKGLLNLTDKSQAELISAVRNLSRSLRYGINLTEDIIDNYINNGVFLLELPKVERYDYDKLENLQRQALLTLISA
jgi:hypothetical protein